MSRYAIMALAALVACSGPDDKGDSGTDTGTTGGDCPDGLFTGPVLITSQEVTCANSAISTMIETQGWTDGGRIFMQETANTPAWAETHNLFSYEFDLCQEWDHLAFGAEGTETLATGVAPADQTPNVSSLFTCDDHINAGVMSYAAEVDDIDGNVAHCVAWGDDPQGMIDGTASSGDRVNEPGFPLAACEVGARAM